jgi:hypothetical protein
MNLFWVEKIRARQVGIYDSRKNKVVTQKMAK